MNDARIAAEIKFQNAVNAYALAGMVYDTAFAAITAVRVADAIDNARTGAFYYVEFEHWMDGNCCVCLLLRVPRNRTPIANADPRDFDAESVSIEEYEAWEDEVWSML